MDAKADKEKEKYDAIWKRMVPYRECSPGEEFLPLFFDTFKSEMRAGQSLIDFGCGTGRVAKDFLSKGLHLILVDISPYCLDEEIRNLIGISGGQISFVPACLWSLPKTLKSAHWIFCSDVLEHLPPECIERSLLGMAKRMRYGGFFSICLKEDQMGEAIGEKLHLTVREADFWREKLSKHFSIVREDVIGDGLYYIVFVESKK